jgi:pectate lyase
VHGERNRLAAGHAVLPPGVWHTIAISVRGTTITGSIDGVQVGTAADGTYASGRVGIGTGWNRAQFDDFTVVPVK